MASGAAGFRAAGRVRLRLFDGTGGGGEITGSPGTACDEMSGRSSFEFTSQTCNCRAGRRCPGSCRPACL